jgi:iron complex transport system substrate-binding protein
LLPCAAEAATFRDALSREITISEHPRRIVSLAPHLTEILFAVGAGPQVVGVTTFCDHPDEVRRLARVGGFSDPSIERVLSLKPDLVLATTVGNRRETVEEMARLGLVVFVAGAEKIRDVPREVRDVGRLVGREAGADRVAREMESRLADISRRIAGRKPVAVYYQIWDQPFITVSTGSFIDDAITLSGGRNVFAGLGQKNPRVSEEAILASRPEVMVLSAMGREGAGLADRWRAHGGVPAVASGRIHIMDSDLLHRPGPRIVQGVERLARWFHPDAFGAGRGGTTMRREGAGR